METAIARLPMHPFAPQSTQRKAARTAVSGALLLLACTPRPPSSQRTFSARSCSTRLPLTVKTRQPPAGGAAEEEGGEGAPAKETKAETAKPTRINARSKSYQKVRGGGGGAPAQAQRHRVCHTACVPRVCCPPAHTLA
jgi:hypothetical protein